MSGPYIYSNPRSLIDPQKRVGDVAGNYVGECVSLLKYYIHDLQNRKTTLWMEGRNVIEAIERGESIAEGTAIATFINGRFISGHGHAALFSRYTRDENGEIVIYVIEQYLGGRPSTGIQERLLPNSGKNPDGTWHDRSNNGRAFSVIL
ncbi:MAG: BPSL0067 family protein [Azoarcus sp.]|jgi:hypothetical protein|nr:BPSL0067 family protein [Azoarcus sp.]